MSDADDFLKQKFEDWCVNITIPKNFQNRVWESINAKTIRLWYSDLVRHPALSFAFACAIMVMFASLGTVSGQHQNLKRMDKFRAHYIEKVSPFIQAHYHLE